MIKEEYIQFETAKLLKEAGFPQDDEYRAYDSDGDFYAHPWEVESECYAAPTQAMVMRWLREEKDVFVSIFRIRRGNVIDAGLGLSHKYYATINQNYYDSTTLYDSYEEAAEAGIQAACEYLIEKRKNHGSDR